MTSIYLIRHAEAEGNLYRIAQGQYDSILTDRGWRQVRALEKRFEGVHIDRVYTSDLYRTCATASALYRPRGLTPIRRKDLREICVGVWEQKTWGEIARRDPEQMENFATRLHLWHMKGAETPYEVRDRALQAIREIAAENEGKTVAVFSHGCAIRLVLAELQGYSMESLGETPHGDNTAVSLLEWENGELKVVYRDDNSHLQTPEYLALERNFKRANALEAGLFFQPLEGGEPCLGFAAEGWAQSGRQEPFDKERFLQSAAERPTVVGYLGQEPVGLVQFGPEEGWISYLTIRQDCRRKGYGIQLIGQAVQHWRQTGAKALWMALPPQAPACKFLTDYGFVPVGTTEEGRTVLEKDIHFEPEFLSDL